MLDHPLFNRVRVPLGVLFTDGLTQCCGFNVLDRHLENVYGHEHLLQNVVHEPLLEQPPVA